MLPDLSADGSAAMRSKSGSSCWCARRRPRGGAEGGDRPGRIAGRSSAKSPATRFTLELSKSTGRPVAEGGPSQPGL